jgi:hypothetical protein
MIKILKKDFTILNSPIIINMAKRITMAVIMGLWLKKPPKPIPNKPKSGICTSKDCLGISGLSKNSASIEPGMSLKEIKPFFDLTTLYHRPGSNLLAGQFGPGVTMTPGLKPRSLASKPGRIRGQKISRKAISARQIARLSPSNLTVSIFLTPVFFVFCFFSADKLFYQLEKMQMA